MAGGLGALVGDPALPLGKGFKMPSLPPRYATASVDDTAVCLTRPLLGKAS
jgi:hypothetical protein